MKKFTKVSFIIVMVLVVVGLSSIVAGGVLGGDWKAVQGSVFDVDDDLKVTIPVEEEASLVPDSSVTEKPASEGAAVYTQEEASSLEIEMLAGELEILVSEDENIYVHSSSDKNVIRAERGCLYIQSDRAILDNKIQVYLPEAFEMKEIDIDLEAGEAKITQLFAKEVDLDVGAGAVIIEEQVMANQFSCSVEAGGAVIHLADAQYVDLDCEAGKLEAVLAGAEADYKGSIECSMGDLQYGAENLSGVDVEKHVGNGGNRTIEADCEVGSVIITFAGLQ